VRHGPPPESFIIYDQTSAPRADDYIIDADYLIETYRVVMIPPLAFRLPWQPGWEKQAGLDI